MTKIIEALSAITKAVFAYRPSDKGLAAARIEKRVKRMAKKNEKKQKDQSNRESSI